MRQAVGHVHISHKTSGNKWDMRLSHIKLVGTSETSAYPTCLSHIKPVGLYVRQAPVPLACRTYFGKTCKWDRCLSHINLLVLCETGACLTCSGLLFYSIFQGFQLLIFISQLKLTTLTSHIVLLMKNNNVCNKNSLQFWTQMIKSID